MEYGVVMDGALLQSMDSTTTALLEELAFDYGTVNILCNPGVDMDVEVTYRETEPSTYYLVNVVFSAPYKVISSRSMPMGPILYEEGLVRRKVALKPSQKFGPNNLFMVLCVLAKSSGDCGDSRIVRHGESLTRTAISRRFRKNYDLLEFVHKMPVEKPSYVIEELV